MVSIIMLVYNHEKFIDEALKGIISQNTSFPFELIIANDQSSDSSELIIQKYRDKFPHIVKGFYNQENLGIGLNFEKALRFAKSKYIALCEGDDYWTDENKLQKQVDFLEANNGYTICFHKVQVLENNKLSNCAITEERYDSIKERPISTKHLLEAGNFIHTPSVVFRNMNLDLPFEFLHSTVGDYFLYIILSKYGHIKRLDDVMAVYRRGVGIFSSLDSMAMQKQVLIYQACILSYLDNEEYKKIMLAKQIALIKVNAEQYQIALVDAIKVGSLQIAKLKIKTFLKRVFTEPSKTPNQVV